MRVLGRRRPVLLRRPGIERSYGTVGGGARPPPQRRLSPGVRDRGPESSTPAFSRAPGFASRRSVGHAAAQRPPQVGGHRVRLAVAAGPHCRFSIHKTRKPRRFKRPWRLWNRFSSLLKNRATRFDEPFRSIETQPSRALSPRQIKSPPPTTPTAIRLGCYLLADRIKQRFRKG